MQIINSDNKWLDFYLSQYNCIYWKHDYHHPLISLDIIDILPTFVRDPLCFIFYSEFLLNLYIIAAKCRIIRTITGIWNERSSIHYVGDSKESHNGAQAMKAVRVDKYDTILLHLLSLSPPLCSTSTCTKLADRNSEWLTVWRWEIENRNSKPYQSDMGT